jgi:hypothetical protein
MDSIDINDYIKKLLDLECSLFSQNFSIDEYNGKIKYITAQAAMEAYCLIQNEEIIYLSKLNIKHIDFKQNISIYSSLFREYWKKTHIFIQ